MGEGERIKARAATLDEMKSQWLGKRGDGISFDEPRRRRRDGAARLAEKIEKVASDNLAQCLAVAKAVGTRAAGTPGRGRRGSRTCRRR
jgi:transcription elongation factor